MARSNEGRAVARGLAGRLTSAHGVWLPALLAIGVLGGLVGLRIVLDVLRLPPNAVELALTGVVVAALTLVLLRWPKLALLLFALYMLFGETISFWLGYGLAQVDEVFVPLALLITALRVRPWRDRIEPVRDGAVAAVIGLAIVSSLVNGVPLLTWLPGLALVVKVIAFLYICAWHDFDARDVRQLGTVVLVVGIAVIGPGYIEAIDPIGFRRVLNVSDVGTARGALPSVKSIFFHPVIYGWFAAFLGLFCFAFYVHYRRWWWLVGGLFFSIGVMLSARRRAIIGLFVAVGGGIAAHWLRARPWRLVARAWAPVAAGLLAVLIVFSAGLGDLIEQTQSEYGGPVVVQPAPGDPGQPVDVVQGTAREHLYRGAVNVAADYFPLGAGLGRYGSFMSRVHYSPLYHDLGFDSVWGLMPTFPLYITDTFWPQILGETGVFGLLAYLVFVASVGLALWRASRVFTDPLLAAFCLGALMVFGHALVETLASSMFHSPPRVYLLFGAVGMALSLRHGVRSGRLAGSA